MLKELIQKIKNSISDSMREFDNQMEEDMKIDDYITKKYLFDKISRYNLVALLFLAVVFGMAISLIISEEISNKLLADVLISSIAISFLFGHLYSYNKSRDLAIKEIGTKW